ncbi:hypothetical protein A0J61_03444 [Choanephora cucurbitarum]|uniref:Uncharacterized protein n=1 Tax=Choanephora cucurbitarum TaxID=101091 RepID=A0A1C7NML2_9FUNG|nr:hypothetical protein A0J61_03444 [Choanephora cucurbitarum]
MTTKVDNLNNAGLQEPTHFCVQQQNSEEHKQTWRLLQRSLERKYQCFMAQLVELQSQLEIIKLDTSISFQSLSAGTYSQTTSSLQLGQLERRLEGHQHSLNQLILSLVKDELVTSKPRSKPSVIPKESDQSSVFSFCESETDQQNEGDWYCSLSDYPVRPRRKRKLYHVSKQQKFTQDSICLDTTSTVSSLAVGDNQLVDLDHRNALDETLSFLDKLASDTDDGGFRYDMCRLLEAEETKDFDDTIQTVHKVNLIQRILYASLRWARYTLVLALAIMINLKKGPHLFP